MTAPGTTEPVVEGLRPPDEGPDAQVRTYRKRMAFWDRIKFLLLFAIAWFAIVWASMADDPILPFNDALRQELRSKTGITIMVLFGLELLRQLHFLFSEHASWYHRLWTKGIFGGIDRTSRRLFSDWTRFRLIRVFKWLLFIAVVALILGTVLKTSPLIALFQVPALLWRAAPLFLQVIFVLFIAVGQFGAIFWFLSRGGVEVYFPDDVKTRFTDVWGQDHVLDRVKENIVYLENPEAIESRGGYVPGGILLWGPPGTGKTLMAEAVAGETGKPYVFVDPGAFINMFFGVGVLKVKGLFRKLRKLALRYGGVIVFFDEADSLGNRGALAQGGPGGGFPRGMTPAPFRADGCHGFSYLSDDSRWMLTKQAMGSGPQDKAVMGGGMGMGGGGMGTLEALLTELSGLKKPRGFVNRYVRRALGMRPKPPPKYRILVMMATNLPEALDEALLRPGRIDRIYKVGYPSKAGRVRTYEGYLAKVKHELTPEQVDKLATITPYATGATIKDMVNEALITAIRDGRDTIIWRDIIRAKQLKELGPAENVEYIERERHAVAVHEACHAVIAYRTRHHMEIDIATIEKGSGYLGMVASIPPEDQFTTWRSHYEADIYVSLASLAGERMFFDGDSSSGVSGDLESATAVATNMEGVWGMGSTVSSYAASSRIGVGTPGGGAPKGEKNEVSVRRQLADRIEDNLGEMLERTATLLKENRREVLALAHALESHKTLTGEDVIAVLEGRPGPLIDGSIYGDDTFISELEMYHRAVLHAHRTHGKLHVSLPARQGAEQLVLVGDPTLPPGDTTIWQRPPSAADMPSPSPNGSTPES